MTTPIPHPVPDVDNAPFWAGCHDHELRLQRCGDCGTVRFPPRPRCHECRSADAAWEVMSGRGVVHTFTICHPPVLPAYADRVPYNVVVVELDEGPYLVSNLVDGEPDVGLPVEVCWLDVDEELSLPQVRSRDPSDSR
jgi:uncharacterized OB-fold protein